jgi:hypothetical protein
VINTKRVVNRRKLQFASVNEILADAERMAAANARPLGNWSPGQIYKHLAIVMDGSIDGDFVQASWLVRKVARLFKNRMLNHGMKAGFKLPRASETAIVPPLTISNEEGLLALRTAVERQLRTPPTKPSPFFGPMTTAEWTQLHCRHAELHLSFLAVD